MLLAAAANLGIPFHLTYKSNQRLHDLPEDEAIYYFAYGFNMATKQLDGRRIDVPTILASKDRWPKDWSLEVKPAIPIGLATLEGYKLNFSKTSVQNPEVHFASVSPDTSSNAEGVLWKLDKKFIALLDFREGVAISQYTRELVNVVVLTKDKAKQIFPALTYIAHPNASAKPGTESKTSKDYQQKLLNGAKEFGLSQTTIDLITNWPTVDEKKD